METAFSRRVVLVHASNLWEKELGLGSGFLGYPGLGSVLPHANFAHWADILDLFLKVATLGVPVAEDRSSVPGHPDLFRGLWECLHHR